MPMKLPGKKIAEVLQTELKLEVSKLTKKGHKPTLVDILIGNADDQISYVKIKEKLAKKLGIGFKLVHIQRTPSFEVFANLLKTHSADPTVTGIIIQQPLPFQLQTDSLYSFIPLSKEIEGHRAKTTFAPPLGLAVLTALKFFYKDCTVSKNLFVDLEKDTVFFKKHLKNKKIGWDIPLAAERLFVEAIEEAAAWDQTEFNEYCEASWHFASHYLHSSNLKKEYLQLFDSTDEHA